MITVLCPHCRTAQAAPADSQVECFACHRLFQAPSASASPDGNRPFTPPPNPLPSTPPELPGTFETARPPAGLWRITLLLAVLLALFVGTATFYLRGKRIQIAAPREAEPPSKQPILPPPPDDVPVRWSDASRYSLVNNGVKVRVTQVRFGEARGKDATGRVIISDAKNHLVFRLSIQNVHSEPVNYRSWYGRAFVEHGRSRSARLVDQSGRTYDMMVFADAEVIEGHAKEAEIIPRERAQDTLIFVLSEEIDPLSIEHLQLELPAAAYGGQGAYRFQIPRSMIQEL